MKQYFYQTTQLLLVALVLFASCKPATKQSTEPPKPRELSGDLGVHDPVMIKEDGKYYIFATGNGVSIKQSDDRYHWTDIGSVFPMDSLPAWHKDDIPEQNGHLWAPDIHYRDGKYHLYYSVSAWMNFNSSVGYATNTTLDPTDPEYKWVDHGMVVGYKTGGEGVNVIDPNIFIDEDGTIWLFYGSFKAGLRAVKINPETGKPFDEENPELFTITPQMGEGVFVLKSTDDYYYIFASEGICCSGMNSTYHVLMGRSKSITGPYIDKAGESWMDNKGTMFLQGDKEEPGRGHNGFFTENDTTFIVYHAYTMSADGHSLLNIKPVYQDEEGWPSMEDTGKLFEVK